MADSYYYNYENSEPTENTTYNSSVLGNFTTPGIGTRAHPDNYGYYYDYYGPYLYPDPYGPSGKHITIYYKGFDFERPVYLYIWIILVLLTTTANILVVLVLTRRSMRNATNVILIAIAISDSLTGLVTIPVMVYAYTHYEAGDLALTEHWCEAFMLVRYFLSRSFHTMSIWLTLLLGIQRLVSVSFPFRAQTLFTIPRTVVAICIVCLVSPFLHIYHAFKKKTIPQGGICEWRLESPCRESCVYLWLVTVLMHFLPCVCLVISTIAMVIMMRKSTQRMRESQMIASQQNLIRRDVESRRISCVVIAIVVVFLIPEIPYGTFFLISASLKHAGRELFDLKTNRSIICAYEILVAVSFQANFWIYLVMNRRFRRGLRLIFDPLIFCTNACLSTIGIKQSFPRIRADSLSFTGRSERRSSENPSHTAHSRLSPLNSINSHIAQAHEPLSPTDSTGPLVEMKTYHFHFDTEGDNKGHPEEH